MMKGKILDKEVTDAVDEYTRQLPGKNDGVSIGKKQYMSKRLILSNLRELYTAFKMKHPHLEIGFSK